MASPDHTPPQDAGSAAAAPAAPAAPAAAMPPPHRRHAWRWWTGGMLAFIVLALLGAGSTLWWGLRSERGTAWLLSRLPGVEVVNPHGRLIGDFGADAIVWRFGKGGELRLTEVAWQGLGVYRSDVPGAWALVWFDRLAANQARLLMPERPQTNTSPPPTQLDLPVELVVRQFLLQELQAAPLGDEPLRSLSARIHLGGRRPGDATPQHRIDELMLARGPLQARGRVQVGAKAPMQSDIALTVVQAATGDWPAWDAKASLKGPLAKSQLQGQLHVDTAAAAATQRTPPTQQTPQAPKAPQSPPTRQQPKDAATTPQALAFDAVLQPFAAWPLAQLNAHAQALDVAALLAGGPRTALSGDVVIEMADAEKPLQARANLQNAKAGDWSAGLLPARQLQLVLQADPRDRRQARLQQFDAELGSATQSAGKVSGDGQLLADGSWKLGLNLQALRPDRVDARAMPMQLEGRVELEGSTTSTNSAAANRQERRIALTSDVSGRLLEGPASAPVQLQAAGSLRSGDGGALAVELQRLVARQGSTHAEAKGQLQRATAQSDWQARGGLTLAAFDPRPWLPASASSALRRAPSRLNGQADVDLTWSPDATAQAAPIASAAASAIAAAQAASAPGGGVLPLPPGLQGRADLRLAQSVLAGVPLQGEAKLRSTRGSDPLQLSLQAEAAGNRVNAEGHLATDPARDHWSARIDAPALDKLAPLMAALSPPAKGTATSTAGRGRAATAAGAGRLQMQAEADGRWPRMRTRGTLQAHAVAFPGGRLRQADARWDLGTAPGAVMDLAADLADLRLDASEQARQVSSLSIKVSGTAERHQLALRSEIAAAPPAWANALQDGGAVPATTATTATTATATATSTATAAGASTRATTAASARPTPASTTPRQAEASGAAGARTRIALDASGALRHGEGGSPLAVSGWRGRIDTLDLQRVENRQSLLRTAGVQLDWQADTPAHPTRLVVQPAQAELLGSRLRWARLSWQAGRSQGQRPEPMQLDADVTLDPLKITPLLARLQPSLGWTGDLAISGRAVVRTAPNLQADVTVERNGGDLSMMQGGLHRPLGLSELRTTLQARGTRWHTDVRVAGRHIGSAQASVTAQATPQSPWPGTQTPIEGTVQLRIADIGVYDAQLPVGWHLSGQLSADARLGGRIGAPTYRGSVRGSELGVSNFVEGVRVQGGELQASLDGERGRIERLTARAGDGQLRAQGDLRFGADPQARITVTAERFRALGRVDRLVDASGQATLDLQAQRIAVQGSFKVDQGLVDLGRGEAPELAKDVRVVDGPTPGRPVKPASQSSPNAKAAAARPVQLDLRVDLGTNLRVRGKGVNTLLAGDLRLTAPGGLLDVEGTVRTVGGTYEAYGEKLRIDRGLVTFVGPIANPRLDIQAVRPDLREVEVGVAIGGTAQNPRVKLFSSPEMTELDKLSWLTLGRSSAGLASDQSAILQRAALALLAGQRGSAGGEGIAKRLGLDKISVGRGASGGLSDAVVSLGKQISERFYVGYAQSLDATGGSWELIYKIARRLTVRVQAGDETALDVVWTWMWG